MKIKNKILILGIGSAQADIIRHCKELGMIVYACARDDLGPGKDLVDEFKQIDIKDIEKVKSYALERDVNFIYSVGSEVSVQTSNIISEELGLPHFISTSTADICKRKNDWRAYIGKEVKGNLFFKTIKSEEDINTWDKYPSILKPVDNSGQRGVFKLLDKEDFYKYYKQSLHYSRSQEVIVEEYIEGPEISVNVYMVNGKIEFYLISDRISFDEYPGGIIKEHIVPSLIVDTAMEKKIIRLINEVARKLNILNGPIYFQLKISSGEPKLIEFTPRLDGCHMWRIIKIYTGVDLIEVVVEHLTNNTTKTLDNYVDKTNNKIYKLKFLCENPDSKFDKNKYEIKDALHVEWYYDQGQVVSDVNGFIEKVGYMIYEDKE